MSSRPLLNLRPPSPINYKIPTQPKKTYYFNIVSLLLHLTSISFIVYLMAKTPQHRIEQVSVRQGQMSVSSIVNDEIITFDNATNTLTIWAMSVIIKPAANQHGRRLIATPASTLSVVGTIKTSHIDTTDISVQELPPAGPAGPAGAQGPPGINGTAGTNGTGAEYLIFRNNELQINVSKVNIAGNLHVDGDFSRDGDEIFI